MGKKKCLFIAVLMLFACSGHARVFGQFFARENQADLLYGKGVHAFFDGNYQGAVDLLLQVSKLESEDPRPYYFLALAYHRLKQDDKADQTFRKAARYEWVGQAARDYNVSDALRRIQGAERLYIEMYRNQAKIDWQKEEKIRRQEKFGQQKAKDKDVLAALAKSFVASAPFGARSVDPFRGTESETGVSGNSVQDRKKSVPEKSTANNEEKTSDDPFAEKDDDGNKPLVDTKTKSDDTGDDPFADPDDSKKDKKKESEQKDKQDDEDDDPFA